MITKEDLIELGQKGEEYMQTKVLYELSLMRQELVQDKNFDPKGNVEKIILDTINYAEKRIETIKI